MFGISWAEFLVILLVAVIVVPSRMWPDVARMLARVVTFVRRLIWKITDASEQIKEQIELQAPIDELIRTTTDDVLADFTTPLKRSRKSAAKKSVKTGGTKCKK